MSRQHLHHLTAIAAAVIVTGAAWATIVPPFEGLDESYYYQVVLEYSKGRAVSKHNLFFKAAAPLLRLADGRDVPYRIRANPGYRPGTNQPGEANFFLHDREHEVSRTHVRQMLAVRGFVLLLSLATIVAVYELARCLFPPEVALLVAGLCLFLPQYSFFSAKVHSDAVATLLSATVYLLLVMRATRRLDRAASWVLLGAVLALVPLADRQVYFLFLLIPFGLVAVEDTIRRRLIAAATILVPSLVFARVYAMSRMGTDVRAWLGPLLPSYRGKWWSDDTLHYLLFEALPKMFFGFIGWFNASILLPSWIYALCFDAAILTVCGFVMAATSRARRRQHDGSGRSRAVFLLTAGILCNVAPILYTNALIVRSPDGRYFFPSLAAIAVVAVLGARALARRAQTDRALAATAAALVAFGALLVWFTGAAAWIDAGIAANHYGNQPHLVRTVRDAAIGLTLTPVLFLALHFALAGRSRPESLFGPMPSAPRVLALAAALNVALLVFFVRPLYVPLDAAQYASLVGDELQAGDFNRASAVATVAAEAHPDSTELRRLASELRFLGTDFEAQQTYFMNRIATGVPLDTRAEYMALARTMRIRDWRDPGSLRSIGGDRSDLGEGPALVRLESDPSRRADPQAVEEILRDARAKPIRAEASGPSRVEGVAVHPAVNGRCEITVYYRPHARWQDRYVWLQIETAGRPPTRLSPNPPQSSVWAPDELAWDSFLTSEARTFDVSFGVQIASNPGGLLRLGRVERCRIAN